MPRAKVADSKPRGRMSAYAYFVQTCREEHKRNHPTESVIFSEFSRKCAERWKIMSEKEKQPFHELADKDKTRYYTEMSGYRGPRVRSRKRRQRKDPNAPKRALSAFFWFCSDERAKIKAIYPNMGVGEIAKELGVRWSNTAVDIKTKCEEMARKDKARYVEEMKAFKSGTYQPPKPAGAAAARSFNDAEDSDGDDEDME